MISCKNSGIIAVFRRADNHLYLFFNCPIFPKTSIMYSSDLCQKAEEQRRAMKGNLFQKSIEKLWKAKKKGWWLEDVRGYCPHLNKIYYFLKVYTPPNIFHEKLLSICHASSC